LREEDEVEVLAQTLQKVVEEGEFLAPTLRKVREETS
jgi:hypothetical protein